MEAGSEQVRINHLGASGAQGRGTTLEPGKRAAAGVALRTGGAIVVRAAASAFGQGPKLFGSHVGAGFRAAGHPGRQARRHPPAADEGCTGADAGVTGEDLRLRVYGGVRQRLLVRFRATVSY